MSPFRHLFYITDVTSGLDKFQGWWGIHRFSRHPSPVPHHCYAQESLPNSPSKSALFQLKVILTCLTHKCLCRSTFVLKRHIKVTPDHSLLHAQQPQSSQSCLICLFLSWRAAQFGFGVSQLPLFEYCEKVIIISD